MSAGPQGPLPVLAWVPRSLACLLWCLPGAAVCVYLTHFSGFDAFCQASSSPWAPVTSQDLWPLDLQFSFIHQVRAPLSPSPTPAEGLLLCWVLGNGHLAGEVGDPTDRCCHRASDAVTRRPRKPWKCGTGPGSQGGFLEEVVPAPKPEGPRRS